VIEKHTAPPYYMNTKILCPKYVGDPLPPFYHFHDTFITEMDDVKMVIIDV
jgi:hypothetical protein